MSSGLPGRLSGSFEVVAETTCPIDEPDEMTPTNGDESTGSSGVASGFVVPATAVASADGTL
jgi:hypothetical protein